MRTLNRIGVALGATLLLGLPLLADAKPQKPGGGSCESTGTERRVGTDGDGNKLDCKWDSCTFKECSSKGGIDNCVQKTTYSNPRDCKVVSASAPRIPGLTQKPAGRAGLQTRPTSPAPAPGRLKAKPRTVR